MGNICRSPSAEGFFVKALKQSDYSGQVSVDSAGTHGWHVGHSPDNRAVDVAENFDVDISHLRARRVSSSDFHEYDLIVAMDRSNLEDLRRIQPREARADLTMMMQYHPDGRPDEVPDPYYGEMDGFTYMCELLESATEGLLRDVEERLGR